MYPCRPRVIDLPFLMPIEDIFSISGRGTVVTGRIERGKIKVGEEAEEEHRRPPGTPQDGSDRRRNVRKSSCMKDLQATTRFCRAAAALPGNVEGGMVLAKTGLSSRTPSSRAKFTS